METSNLLDAEFKARVMRMVIELSENFNTIKKNKSEMKGTLTKTKKKFQRINSRVDEVKNKISNLEYKKAKKHPIRTTEQKESKKYAAKSLWDNFKYTNTQIMGVPEGEESKGLRTYLT